MSNQSFNQWASAQPAPAGFNPAGAPAAAAPAWGAPPVAPAAPPVSAPPAYTPPAAPVAPQAQPTGGNVFGAGAFAGAAPISERKDCQYGDYVLEIVKTEQYRTREGKPMFRILSKVVHAYGGNQPVGSEVTDTIFFGYPGTDAFKYGMADMLFLAAYALGCGSDGELRAKLAGLKPDCPDAWAALADAMQDPNQQLNQYFPPNPLKGMFYRAIVSQGSPNPKKPGTFYTEWQRLLAKAG